MGNFEGAAEQWITWARTPGFDAYWHYRDTFFDEIVPPPGRLTVDVGCGEGRVARDLAARGHRAVGLDPSPTLVKAAADEDRSLAAVVADGAALPVRDASAEVVVAYNALQVVDDLDATVAEATRVLTPGGHLCVCIVHPVTDFGRMGDDGDGPRLTLRPRYYDIERVDDTIEREGNTMRFTGWTHTLEHHVRALEAAGLMIDRLREPPLPDGGPGYLEDWRHAPLFLMFRAVKPG